jgi:hypothetical protein
MGLDSVKEESLLAIPVTAAVLGGVGKWAKVTLEWDWKKKNS